MMDELIKQRLVGALVLVALMIIFLPMIFDEDQARQAELADIPLRPDMPQLDMERPVPPSSSGRQETDSQPNEKQQTTTTKTQSANEAVTESASSAKQQTVTDTTKPQLPEAWALQLASFQDPTNAEALRDKLREAGFKAYIQQRPGTNPQMLRVMVGPELKRSNMDKIKAQIMQRFGLEGLVVQFEP